MKTPRPLQQAAVDEIVNHNEELAGMANRKLTMQDGKIIS